MTPSPALNALRASTSGSHQSLESALAVASPHATRQDYLHYLEDMYGWLCGFEAPLWGAEWPATLEAGARDGKLAWIEQDLGSAGMSHADIGALPRAAFAPDLSRQASRFGLAYVIEGAQLGTRQLRQHLAPALDGWEPRWLEGYGDSNGSRWRAFLESLGQHVSSAQDIDDACAAAVAGFDSLASWFEQRSVHRAAHAMAG